MEEVRLAEELGHLLPATAAGEDVGRGIRRMFLRHLGEKSFFYLDSLSATLFGTFLGGLPESPLLAVIGTDSGDSKIIAQIDTNLAFLVMDRLLGGNAIPNVENRPLSETEQGVLQYFIMQALLELWKACGESTRYHFRFEKFLFSARDAEKAFQQKDLMAVPVYKVGIGELSGFLRLYIPEPFVKKAAQIGGAVRKGEENKYFLSGVDRYGYISTVLWLDGGRATVSNTELASLEPGDVVLFDETALSLKDGGIEGMADLKAGQGDEGALKVKLAPLDRSIKCTVIGG